MRRIVGAIFQTLDGVMQAPGGKSEDPTDGFAHGGWQMGYRDKVAEAAIGELLKPPFALLLGRRTYDIFASYWPFVEGEEQGIGEAFSKADKYVLTHGEPRLDWENSHRVSSMDELRKIKDGDGPDLRIWGSGAIYPALIEAGLLDSLTLLTYPLVLGDGKRTFRGGTPASAMKLTKHETGPSGVLITTLEPGGEIPKGSISQAPPNEREERRQKEMAEGRW
ncbi:dihydrofolate reductase family protein [Sphingomonas sp.]|uniref:dihydrofolate reductase family protein n=1 Tax=Sphingomonas sp. TaxID=28214 RepID=UPI0025F75B7C|nr:dihydrofolate reductase family protein [Sphingomonas sp.]MBV9528497.1 dihydrofolate reductase family protein [Sphingomonas sp.]